RDSELAAARLPINSGPTVHGPPGCCRTRNARFRSRFRLVSSCRFRPICPRRSPALRSLGGNRATLKTRAGPGRVAWTLRPARVEQHQLIRQQEEIQADEDMEQPSDAKARAEEWVLLVDDEERQAGRSHRILAEQEDELAPREEML